MASTEALRVFRKSEQPFLNVTVQLDVTETWKKSRTDESYGFAAAIHHASLAAANDTECFRYRLRGDRVLVHESFRIGMRDSVNLAGKCHESGGRFKHPVAVDAHHALVDGLQVGEFFRILEVNFSNPPV